MNILIATALDWAPSAGSIAMGIIVCILAIALLAIIKHKESHTSTATTKVSRKQIRKSPISVTGTKADIVGLYLGVVQRTKYAFLAAAKEFHSLILGESGSGKSSAIIIPTLDHWPGGGFVLDCEGDLTMYAHCKSSKLWSPVITGRPYNIFGQIDRLSSVREQNEALAGLAHLLISDVGDDASEAARYFCEAARAFLTAGLIVLYHRGLDFCDACTAICSLDGVEFLSKIKQSGNEVAIRYVKAYMGSGERNIGSCMTSCCNPIKIFATLDCLRETVRRPAPGEDCFEVTMVEETNVFAYIPRQDLALYSPLLRVVLGQVLNHLEGRVYSPDKAPVLLVLDEFVTLGRMEKLLNALRTFRKRGVRIMLCTQCLADIDAVYGTYARSSILNNCTFKFILGTSDTSTQEDISRLVGHHKVKRVSTTDSAGGTSYTTHTEEERIVPPETLGRLKGKYLLLYPGGHMFIRKYPYYQFREHARPPVFPVRWKREN